MPRYRVEWVIDIEDADTPREAAEQAFEIMQRPSTSANFFHVYKADGDGEAVQVDLLEEE